MSETEYLIEIMTIDLAKIYMANNPGVNLHSALDVIYNSETYEKVISPDTNLKYQNPGYVYRFLESELHTGHL